MATAIPRTPSMAWGHRPRTLSWRLGDGSTGRHNLRALTLLTWAQVLPRVALLRRARARCESCFHAWHQAHQPLYEPLLWTLQAVTVCPYHQRPLHHVCPHCECPLGPLDWRSRSAYCSRCAHTLVPRAVGPVQTLPRHEILWATWVASACGELLAAAPQIGCPPARDRLAHTIGLCIEHTSAGNASAFARLMQVGRGDVSQWQRGKAVPRFTLLLHMAYGLGTSLLDFLLGSSAAMTACGLVRAAPVALPSPAHRRTAQGGRRRNGPEVSAHPPRRANREPAALGQRCAEAPRKCGEHRPLPFSRPLPCDCAPVRGTSGEMCDGQKGTCGRRGATRRLSAPCQRAPPHTPEHTPAVDEFRLTQPPGGPGSSARGPLAVGPLGQEGQARAQRNQGYGWILQSYGSKLCKPMGKVTCSCDAYLRLSGGFMCQTTFIHPTGLHGLTLTGLNKVELLIRAVGDRHRVKPEPPVYQGGVGATEIVVEVEIAFELILVPQRRILAVRPPPHRCAHDKRHAARAVIRARTIVSDAATDPRT